MLYLDILSKLGLDPNTQIKKPIRGLPGITLGNLVKVLIDVDTIEKAAERLGYTTNPVKQAIRSTLIPVFISRSKEFKTGGATRSWKVELLACIYKKECTDCGQILDITEFNSNLYKFDSVESYCKKCSTHRSKLRKQYIVQRTPKWADLVSIRTKYINCPKGMHVDHIIPLRGKYVSGLHVVDNLQYLTPEENLLKSNKS